MSEEETVRWMMPTGATVLTVLKNDLPRNQKNRAIKKRERRERMDEWRQMVRETKLMLLTPDDAREQICSSFRGILARDPSSLVSYMDGTMHLRTEIEQYNHIVRDRVLQMLHTSGVVENTNILDPKDAVPPVGASHEEIAAFNANALSHCKEIYLLYPFTRTMDVYGEVY